MRIITLTLNPAFDKHCYVKSFNPFHENVASVISLEAGGKGVNVSRALTANDVKNVAITVLGSENKSEFEKQLQKDGVNYKTIVAEGRIRENLTLHSGDGQAETRISFNGFTLTDDVFDKVTDELGDASDDTIVTFTGSIPNGISTLKAKKFLLNLKNKGVKTVVDCRSFNIDDLIELKPWLIKPNKDEAENYAKKPVKTVNDAIDVANNWRLCGIENVIISLGKTGAILACEDGNYAAETKKIDAVSTIGAGDSMIAGFIAAFINGEPPTQRLQKAVAFGTAACMQEGTKPPLKLDVCNIIDEIKITKF